MVRNRNRQGFQRVLLFHTSTRLRDEAHFHEWPEERIAGHPVSKSEATQSQSSITPTPKKAVKKATEGKSSAGRGKFTKKKSSSDEKDDDFDAPRAKELGPKGQAWPPFPAPILRAWSDLADYIAPPEACLINYYDGSARMGLHQDRDEESFSAPVVSLSLGDTCVFRYGGTERRAPTKSVRLSSGDALVLGGSSRLAFHGVDRVLAGSSSLLAEGGRINLTLRRVTGDPL